MFLQERNARKGVLYENKICFQNECSFGSNRWIWSCNHGNKVSQQGSGGSVNTQRSLDELICGSNGFYFYFSRGSVYVCQFKNDSWQKFSAGTYEGNQFTDLDGEKYTVIISEITVTFQGPEPATHLICTDPNILKIVKNL